MMQFDAGVSGAGDDDLVVRGAPFVDGLQRHRDAFRFAPALRPRARGLLTHESRGFRDPGPSGSLAWDPAPRSDRGASLTLTQTMGASASGGMDALVGRGILAGPAANDNGDDLETRRLELRLDYGFSAFGDRLTSDAGDRGRVSNTGQDYSLGWRLNLATGARPRSIPGSRRPGANTRTTMPRQSTASGCG